MGKGQNATSKHDRILEIYSRLLAGEVVYKLTLAEEYGVNQRSIQRDIDSIRNFYSNRAVNCGDVTEIIYDRSAKGFRIESPKTDVLTNAELFVAAKILLESRSLNKKEMGLITENLIKACLPAAERQKMAQLLRNEIFHYVEPRHAKDMVNQIWDLAGAVYSHKITRLEYQKIDGKATNALVKPVGIMESEYYFYLIAYVGDKDKKYPGYPTIYRMDRITRYQITKEVFHVPYKDRFEEGEFRKRIPFMYGGKLHKTSFIYKGPDINAVLDRLPTAAATKRVDGSYHVTAEVFGEMGIGMWLKSQGDKIRPCRLNY